MSMLEKLVFLLNQKADFAFLDFLVIIILKFTHKKNLEM